MEYYFLPYNITKEMLKIMSIITEKLILKSKLNFCKLFETFIRDET